MIPLASFFRSNRSGQHGLKHTNGMAKLATVQNISTSWRTISWCRRGGGTSGLSGDVRARIPPKKKMKR